MKFSLSTLPGTRLLLLLTLLFSFSVAQAQNNSWDDDDEEEEEEGTDPNAAAAPESAVKYDEALIMVDGKEFKLQPEIVCEKNDTIDISVRRLMPNSGVSVIIKKGGVVLKKTAFYANEKGELDLELHTGGKMAGTATVYYYPSSGKRKTFDVTVKIQ